MIDLAQDDSIVIFNVSHIRSDAFLVDKRGIRVLNLPLLKHDDVQTRSEVLQHTLETVCLKSYSNVKLQMNELLEWLWDVAVGPVLEALGFHDNRAPNDSSWPRVWWMGSGILNIMPIHAAGYHNENPPRSALDRVVSSYIPTMKSLLYARQREAQSTTFLEQKVMLVIMPTTPGQEDLEFAENELNEIEALLPCKPTIKQSPTKQDVLTSLADYQVVHFCCHGISSATDPSQSKLLLTDWQTAPLTVSDLIASNIPLPQFGFLSACDTANSKHPGLFDESINLCSAILLAGFPSVVGTLWRVSDKHSVEVATGVYRHMLMMGTLNTRRSAEGLHHAIRQLRDQTRTSFRFTRKVPSDPLLWAPYIHLGV